MRDIKFRAWWRKKMLYGIENIYDDVFDNFGHVLCAVERGEVCLMQYTGLKDRDGMEIYEGDIISYPFQTSDFGPGAKSVVVYIDGGFNPFAANPDNLPSPRPEECEVIGNIHQNSELLDGQEVHT